MDDPSKAKILSDCISTDFWFVLIFFGGSATILVITFYLNDFKLKQTFLAFIGLGKNDPLLLKEFSFLVVMVAMGRIIYIWPTCFP